MSRGRLTATVCLTVLLLGGSCAPKSFDNIFPSTTTKKAGRICRNAQVDLNYGICRTDNRDLDYFSDSSVGSSLDTRIANTMEAQYEPTDLKVDTELSPTYDDGSCCETDIIFQAGSQGLSAGADGVTWCQSRDDEIRCDQHFVRFRYQSADAGAICHEAGHAIGLLHGDSSFEKQMDVTPALGCMQQRPNRPSALGSHNRKQIDATF